jgi:hypothetical protein
MLAPVTWADSDWRKDVTRLMLAIPKQARPAFNDGFPMVLPAKAQVELLCYLVVAQPIAHARAAR